MSDNFLIYENITLGIRVLHPYNWNVKLAEPVKGVGASVGFVNMSQGDPVCVISVRDPCPDTLDQFFNLRAHSPFTPVISKFIEVTSITIDHNPAKKLTYIDNNLCYGLDLLSVKNGRGYLMSIVMTPDHIPEYMSIAEKMISSFQILK